MLLNPNTKLNDLQREIAGTLTSVYDPEISVNIYELGLIYEINVDNENNVEIVMTLTSPNCPMVDQLYAEIEMKVAAVPTVKSVKLEITFNPPWDYDRMTDEAKLMLGLL